MYNCPMPTNHRKLTTTLGAITLSFAALSFSALSHGAEPVIDNDRVTAWITTGVAPPVQHDFVAVSLARKGTAVFGHQGDTPGKPGERTVIVELKGHALPPLANSSGYPLAFPRPHVKKLFENDQVIVWDYAWRKGEPSPMHFHDKDTLVVYEADGALQSTTPDGKITVNENKFGDVRFNKRDRVHTELLLHGQAHAVITELK
jgi:quercetin dioxygenase-like cupin family protein